MTLSDNEFDSQSQGVKLKTKHNAKVRKFVPQSSNKTTEMTLDHSRSQIGEDYDPSEHLEEEK